MQAEIEELESQLKRLKAAYSEHCKTSYESQPHKHFEKGDIVTNGNYLGVVEWTENIGIGCQYEKGYMGINIINGNRGFWGGAKRDEYEIVTDPYYTSTHKIEIEMTGLEIEELKYTIGPRNCNPNNIKERLLDYLRTLRATA